MTPLVLLTPKWILSEDREYAVPLTVRSVTAMFPRIVRLGVNYSYLQRCTLERKYGGLLLVLTFSK